MVKIGVDVEATLERLELWHTWAEFVSSIFVGLACAVSFATIWSHLKYNKHAALRNYTVRILLMVPVYAIESWCALRWVRFAMVLQLVREVYEAFVIFSFMQFVLTFLGGPLELAETLEAEAQQAQAHEWARTVAQVQRERPEADSTGSGTVGNKAASTARPSIQLETAAPVTPPALTLHFFPFCCLEPWRGSRFVRRTLLGVLQYVPIQLLSSLVVMVGWCTGTYNPGRFRLTDTWPWVMAVRNASQCWALYCLVLFYRVNVSRMLQVRPLAKFLCIKFVVFFTFWQAFMLTLLQRAHVSAILRLNQQLVGSQASASEMQAVQWTWRQSSLRDELSTALLNFVLCVEMFVFALGHAHAYPATEFSAQQLQQMSLGPATPPAVVTPVQANGIGFSGWGITARQTAHSEAAEETIPLVLDAGAGAGAGGASDYATGGSKVHAAAVIPAADEGEGAGVDRPTVAPSQAPEANKRRDTDDDGVRSEDAGGSDGHQGCVPESALSQVAPLEHVAPLHPRLSRTVSAPLRVKFVQGINLLDIIEAAREIRHVQGVGSPMTAAKILASMGSGEDSEESRDCGTASLGEASGRGNEFAGAASASWDTIDSDDGDIDDDDDVNADLNANGDG